jgi:hypothetical protein
MRRPRGLVLSSMVLVAACGEAPPPVVSVPKPAPVVVAAPDLSPVAEPKSLLALVRWKAPTHGIEHALHLLALPLSIDAMLEKAEPEVFRALRLDASFDAAVALDPSSADDDPKVFVVASVPLASFAEARAAAERRYAGLEEIAPGVLRIPAKANAEARCDLAMSVGDAPARVVCGAKTRDLDALRDYMTRGLAHAPPARDALEASVRFRALKDRWLPRLHAESATLEKAARGYLEREGVHDAELLAVPGVAIQESERFADDLDRLDFRFGLNDKPPEFFGGGTLRFAGRSSWLTQVLTDASTHEQPAPAMFWRLPKDASSASWGQSGDPARFEGIRHVVHAAMGAALDRLPALPADKGALVAFVDHVPKASGPWVYATGTLRFDALPEKPGPHSTAAVLAEAKAYATTALGWVLVGVHGNPDPYVTWGKEAVDMYQRGVRFAKTTMVKTAADKDLVAFIPTFTAVSAPPGWPKGTVAFDLRVTFDREAAEVLLPHEKDPQPIANSKSKAAKKPPRSASQKESITLRLAVVPDGDDTWIGFSGDPAELLKRVKAAMSGGPDAATIAKREGLGPLHAGDRTSGGFVTFGDAIDGAVKGWLREKPKNAELVEALVAAMPNRGATPILFSGSGTGGNAPSLSAELRLEQGTLVDIAGLVSFLLSERGRKLTDTVL